jgi:protein arginine kinase
MEMHYVSPDFVSTDRVRALLSGENDRVKIMVCEEDHLRIQSIVSGFEPKKAYEYASTADDRICRELKIAYSEKYGYLTACPTNLGGAMRVSAMLCLPALTLKNLIPSYEQAMSKMGITIRGLYGEGSKASGCLYQISNRASLGIDETEILKLIGDVVKNLAEAERTARKNLFELKRDALTDKISRSVGLLKNAHVLSSAEFNSGFSDIKMGLSIGILSGITDEKMSEILVAVQPATISMTGEGLDGDSARDVARARLVRDMLSAVTVKHI